MDIIILFGAGLFAGALNSLAGGGSFVIFPALLFVGVPPIMANATNTFACLPGYGSGAIGFKEDILRHKDKLLQYSIISLIAGYLGAEAVLRVSDEQFSGLIPWLMGFAVLAFSFGGKLNAWMAERSSNSARAAKTGSILTAGLLALICFYGGFFNAGLGIILLAYLVLAGFKDLNAMNGLKLLISFLVSITAVVRFAMSGSIEWQSGTVALVGATIGGFVAAKYAYLLPASLIRNFVIVYGIGLTVYFFYGQYF
ncbi:sulfite exporter TauE/SafE family protein [Maritalea sp.]|uniref:sulfite exporter TauE/SafE family protein n=1 Tax=Maritalea sp. TaxID=2003361 RepID=UPI003EF64957